MLGSMVAVAPTEPEVLHLSAVVGARLLDAEGGALGRVDDLISRLGIDDHPPVTGLLATVAGRQTYVPADLIADIGARGVILHVPRLDLRPFARRPEEVLLRKDVLDRQLINIDGARLVRANEIELARAAGRWRVVGVDTGPRGAVRRLLPRALAGRVALGTFLDWASIEPFVGHVPTVRLKVPHPKLARLHPAQIADLVEAASHEEGEEIIAAVGADGAREADVFEELDEQHRREFVRERSDEDVVAVLARMASDDAADMLADLDDERRARILDRLPEPRRTKVRALLGYDPATAGGLMSGDFLCLYRRATVTDATARLRRADVPDDTTSAVFVMDAHKRVTGFVPLLALVRSDGERQLGDVELPTPSLRPDAEIEEIARLMADYDLTMAPVVDDEHRMIGVVTVDDVLEVLLPKGWRRRFGLLGDG